MKRDYSKHLRRFHEAKWDEELIFDLSVPGQRGVNVTTVSYTHLTPAAVATPADRNATLRLYSTDFNISGLASTSR